LVALRLPALWALGTSCLWAQAVLQTPKQIADAKELLETYRGRPAHCEVTPTGPRFNFTLRLRAGYFARVALRGARAKQKWVVLMRVTPLKGDKTPVYLSEVLPFAVQANNGREGEVRGFFWLGEGRYAVKWMMFDGAGDVCRKQWEVDARLTGAERKVQALMPPNTVQGVSWSAGRRGGAPVVGRLTILLHAASLEQGKAEPGMQSKGALLDALSALMAEIPARSVRLVMFNLDQQAELLRADGFTLERMPEVAKAMDAVPWAVDYRLLQDPGGRVDLIEKLAAEEMRAAEPADAVVFLGPHSIYNGKPSAAFARSEGAKQRFYYVMYGNTAVRRGGMGGGGGGGAIPGYEGIRGTMVMGDPGPLTPPEGSAGTGPSPARVTGVRRNNGPDSIQYAVEQLGGKVLKVDTPDSLARAVAEMIAGLGAGR